MSAPRRCWHYTDPQGLAGMLQSGSIKPSKFITDNTCLDITWLSSNKIWEPICKAGLMYGCEDPLICHALGQDDVGAVRIETDSCQATCWAEYLSAHGVSRLSIFHLAMTGTEWGSSPDDWFIVPDAVDVTRWLGIDIWDGSEWERVWRYTLPGRATRSRMMSLLNPFFAPGENQKYLRRK